VPRQFGLYRIGSGFVASCAGRCDGRRSGRVPGRPPELLLARARCFAHRAWLEGERLLGDADLPTGGIPAVLIQRCMDIGVLDTAWEMAWACPGAGREVLERTGHSGSNEMTARPIRMLNDSSGRLRTCWPPH
jgi:hypothetical protein